MVSKIKEAVCRYGMEKIYNGAIVGFSGGADSSALLHYLKNSQGDSCSNLIAVHVNHMIRGREAQRDEDFCRSVCERYGVRLLVFKVDIPAIAKKNHMGLEETARQERYRIFSEVLRDNPSCGCIVTAHNANDNGETIVFNLARGSGTNGLSGIKPVYGDVYRPLIYSTRDDIIKYCVDNNIEYVTDSTNEDTDYTRNRIRHCIMPELMEINPNFLTSCIRLGEILRSDEEYISKEVHLVLEASQNGKIPKEKITVLDSAVLSRVLKAVSKRNLEFTSIKACEQLLRKWQTGKMVNLENGLTFKLERDYCSFISTVETQRRSFEASLNLGVNEIDGTGLVICINCTLDKKGYILAGSVRLSTNGVNGSLYARSRQEGDTVKSMGMTKKLKRVLSDKHIPSHERDLIPVICDNTGILAVPGIIARDGAFDKKGDLIIRVYKKSV